MLARRRSEVGIRERRSVWHKPLRSPLLVSSSFTPHIAHSPKLVLHASKYSYMLGCFYADTANLLVAS